MDNLEGPVNSAERGFTNMLLVVSCGRGGLAATHAHSNQPPLHLYGPSRDLYQTISVASGDGGRSGLLQVRP